jgi:hypothetical protein
MLPLDTTGSAVIPVRPFAFNIITSPFDVPVPWSLVVEANGGVVIPDTVWSFERGYRRSGVLEPFKGYYYRDRSGSSSLKIPYPFAGRDHQPPVRQKPAWSLELAVEGPASRYQSTRIGILPSARHTLDSYDEYKPPPVFDQTYLCLRRDHWDAGYPYFSSDFRPALGDGQTWDFEVANPALPPTTVTVTGVEQVPPEYRVVLTRVDAVVPIDLRSTQDLTFLPQSRVTQFKLVVGGTEYVQDVVRDLVPRKSSLKQNYPNPFNPSTTIAYDVPSPSRVTLSVYSVLGQLVATLVDDVQSAGAKQVDFNCPGLSSGTYFYRLTITPLSDGRGRVYERTLKMQLLK